METSTGKQKRFLEGVVVSDKMEKTIVVKVQRTYEHPEFHKILRRTKAYKVHDELNQAKTGDIVEFYEGRPVAKSKYMYLSRIVKSVA